MKYGPLKVLCERAIEEVLPSRVLTVRPGLIVGPYDYTDCFTYWPRRVSMGGEVLAPGRPERQVQFIDARDLSEWIVRMVESGIVGVFNANGPDYTLTMQEVLEECKNVSGSQAHFTWVSDGFVMEAGVAPWIELPLWIPEAIPALLGVMSINSEKAMAASLTFRPLADTIRDVLSWSNTRPEGYVPIAGMKREREAQLLREWQRACG
jgi:2'-hydroxyisoflavone reductase